MAAGANPRYYRILAVALGIGIVVAAILGFTGVTGPGLLELEASIVTLFLTTIVTVVILTFFLVRVGDIFSIEKKVQAMLESEGAKWAASLQAEQAKADELREALRRDAHKVNQDVLKESASQRMRIDDANTAAVRAANEAQAALAQIAELRRRPETSQDVVALGNKLTLTEKEMAELKRRDNVNSPLLKELQEQVKALQAQIKTMSNRLAEALDSAEKREMDAAATRTGLDHEVSELRKREQLLMLKMKDLETKAGATMVGKPRTVTIADDER